MWAAHASVLEMGGEQACLSTAGRQAAAVDQPHACSTPPARPPGPASSQEKLAPYLEAAKRLYKELVRWANSNRHTNNRASAEHSPCSISPAHTQHTHTHTLSLLLAECARLCVTKVIAACSALHPLFTPPQRAAGQE